MAAGTKSRAAVFAGALAFSAACILAVVLLDSLYFSRIIPSPVLFGALTVAGVQCAAIGVWFCVKLPREFRARRAARVRPHIRELLAAHAIGSNRREEIRRLWRTDKDLIEACLADFLRTVRGRARETLSELAADLALPRH